jgi:hypothetical protein
MLLVGVVGVLAVGAGFAKDENAAEAKCSGATLHGRYLVTYEGVEIRGNNQVPFAVAGYEVYNGNGKVKGVYSVNFNGKVFRNLHFPGTYTVEANCTGTSTLTDPDATHFDLFIAPDGRMFTWSRPIPSLM